VPEDRTTGATGGGGQVWGQPAAAPNTKALVGVWDQWCVMSARPYVKMLEDAEGRPEPQISLLDEEHCRLIVRNFGNSKDDLPCTLGHHQDTPAKAKWSVAGYSAMVTMVGGRPVEFATHNPEVSPPTLEDLPRPDSGGPPDDGNYVFRARVTPLGAALIRSEAVRKSSPEFVMNGLDQHAKDLGPQAQGLAWTNDPFLTGCEINLERYSGSAHQMICLVPPPEVAEQLALPGGSAPADLHCTLAVLEAPLPAAVGVAYAAAATFEGGPLRGVISGPARFTGADTDVVCALVDCPSLGQLRQRIVDALQAAGGRVKLDHDFQPHITLAFVSSTEPLPSRIGPIEVVFADLVVQLGTKQQRYPLQGDPVKKKHLMEAGVTDADKPAEAVAKMSRHYGKRTMMEAGVMDADSPETAMAKMDKHMSKMEGGAADPSMMAKFEVPPEMMAKMDKALYDDINMQVGRGEMPAAEAMGRYQKAHMEKHGKAFEYEDPIVRPGAPTHVDEPPLDNTVVMERERQARAAGRETIETLTARMRDQDNRLRIYERNEQERAKADKRREATKAVDAAWAAGQIVMKPGESMAAAKERFIRHYERGKDAFEDALCPPGTESTIEQTQRRLTQGGLPVNYERGNIEVESGRPDDEIIRLAEAVMKAKPGLRRLAAVKQVCMERPGLEAAYRGQAKAAILE